MSDTTLEIGKENPPAGEEAAIENLRALHLKVQHVKPGPNRRGEHPKSHGGVWAVFNVRPDIPPEYRIGLFQEPRSYTAFVRFSNGHTDDDRQSDVRGMALKVLIPQGEGLPPLQQDFLMANHSVFFAQNVQHLFEFLAATATGTPSAQLAMTTHPKLVGFTSAAATSLLSTTYWSQTPYKLGDGAVKYLTLPSGETPEMALEDSADCLRSALIEQLTFRKIVARFDFCINPQTDAATMPIEDPTVEWTSPPVKLAALSIYPQKFDSAEQLTFVENLQWNPWNGLPPHAPLGGINRARRVVYGDSQQLRHETNKVQPFAPTGRESF